ncbi:protein FAR-RED IMPAIRED RESPONSE 1-like [Camellia sinensis]|uniref:protein FAR-RED IMPAIRED RESPONSE 1-like n=1 Tax=Camellia sinensis TaxID=4442 RepID=UPI001035CF81|nr:protein FAR-RED IMPAIRED RESPONSE 1-like [Camellia sinensis]
MIEKFSLHDNEWLGVLYAERHRWIPAYVKDIFWAGMSTTQRSESMNAVFDGYVNSKTTLKQFVEQYDNALRSKVEKDTKADFKSRDRLYDCLMVYEFEKQFRVAYTNAKFKEVQVELKRLLYCHANLVKEEGSICTYHVKEVVLVGEKMKKVEFLVYFNSTEFEMQCVCRWFEFRGIMCAHSLSVLIERSIYEIPNKYIMSRWRKDLERGYTCIPTTYTKSGAGLNAKVHENYHKTLDEIIEIASNNDGKHKAIQLGLREIKERVRKDESRCASNVPPSSSTVPPCSSNVPPCSTTRKVLSPLVARRRGRPCMKRKVSKVDEIVNRLKGKNKKATKVQGRKMGQCEPRKLNFGCTDGMENNMYNRVPEAQSYYFPCMDGTQESALQMVDKVGSSSLSESGMANIDGSTFVDFNIDVIFDSEQQILFKQVFTDLNVNFWTDSGMNVNRF